MSIEFKSPKGIFLQIVENLCNQILEGSLKPGDRAPSVRELSEEFEVNRNTVLRSFTIMNDNGIFEFSRGVGYFISETAVNKILETEKAEFFKNDLPVFIQKVKVLKLTGEDLKELTNQIKNNENNETK